MAHALVEKYIQSGYSVVIDSDCAGPETKRKIVEIEEKYKIPVVWVHINPPEDFIINKFRHYKHTWLFKDGEHAV